MTHFHPRGKIERGGEGEAGNTTHAHPPTSTPAPPACGGKEADTRGGGGEGVGLNFLSFFSQG